MWKPALVILSAVVVVGCSSSGPGKTAGSSVPGTTTELFTGGTVPSVTSVPQTLNPCKLLTVKEASRLAGATVKLARGGGVGSLNCVYAAGTAAGAELSVKIDADASSAQDDFPSWVQPIPGTAAGLTVTPVANLGDQATSTHTKNSNDAIYVRKGRLLLKIGAHPPTGDAALRAAATRALARAGAVASG